MCCIEVLSSNDKTTGVLMLVLVALWGEGRCTLSWLLCSLSLWVETGALRETVEENAELTEWSPR